MSPPPPNQHIRYGPDDRCPPLLAIGIGIQGIIIVLAPTVLIVAITALASGQDERFMSWAVFAALIITGAATALQAARIGRLGGGHLLISGVTPNFIAVTVLALEEGGPALLASLMVVSSLFYLAVAAWLPLLRRILTPVVSGIVLILIAAMVLPIAFDRLSEIPEGAPPAAGPGAAAVTLFVSAMLMLRAPGSLRPWSLLIGIAAGCAAAAPFGLYDFERLAAAPWVGIPASGFPELDLTLTSGFWAMLPMFLIVILVQAIKNISDCVVAQRVARPRARATDFRLIQGSVYANGAGILMSGIAGTPPTTSYSSLTASLINLTGVSARRVGYAMGCLLVVLAFFPKVTGFLLTIPSPVMGGFLLVALGMFFVEGIQTLARAGLDVKNAMVAGLAFSIGLGMEHHNILEDITGKSLGDVDRQRHDHGHGDRDCPDRVPGADQASAPASRSPAGHLRPSPDRRVSAGGCSRDELGRGLDGTVALRRRGDSGELVAAWRRKPRRQGAPPHRLRASRRWFRGNGVSGGFRRGEPRRPARLSGRRDRNPR